MKINDLFLEFYVNKISLSLTDDGLNLRILCKKGGLDVEAREFIKKNKEIIIKEINAGIIDNFRVTGGAARDDRHLIDISRNDIRAIAEFTPGGSANIQDIYPLAPLQEGIFFHYLLQREGDVYLHPNLIAFDSRSRLDRFVDALQRVIDRHDILRTAMAWEGLAAPVQVVWRHAPLVIEEVHLEQADGDVAAQLQSRFDPRHWRMDVRQAPLMRGFAAHDPANGRWLLQLLCHNLALDHTTLEEVGCHLRDAADSLPPAVPFRNFVAQALLGVSREEHEAYFRTLLGDVDEPCAPFGLVDVQGDGSDVEEVRLDLPDRLSALLRSQARELGVSAASLFHLAWAQVVARATGHERVVFGTVLFGRMQGGAGADRALGLFINNLPLRIEIDGSSVMESVRVVQKRLAALLRHEHAPLSLAQRCSGVPAPAPLFTSLLNYRHSAQAKGAAEAMAWEGIETLSAHERTNYPLFVSVDDVGSGFALTVQSQRPLAPERICAFLVKALEELADALAHAPETTVRDLDVLPEAERHQILMEWNATAADYPRDACVHELFEAQVARDPSAIAVVQGEVALTYAELNARANRLAHYLRGLGVRPDDRVAICVQRSVEMVVAVVAVLKAGGAYVPLDPAYPPERLAYMQSDCGAVAVLTDAASRRLVECSAIAAVIVDLQADSEHWTHLPDSNPDRHANGLTTRHLAYVIYTSGSTGAPKGVMIEHRNLCNYALDAVTLFGVKNSDFVLQQNSMSFDLSVEEIFPALLGGAALVLAPTIFGAVDEASGNISSHPRVTVVHLTMAHWHSLVGAWKQSPELARAQLQGVRLLNVTGDAISPQKLREWYALRPHGIEVVNTYGPTETTVSCTAEHLTEDTEYDSIVTIGKPLANTRIYILDTHGAPVPIGVVGELYIGGDGVGRGYLNRDDLTAARFLADPFSADPTARMYRTGDLGRWCADGTIEFVGRNDHQVKIRGFRIELGEIEARLSAHADVRECVVVTLEDGAGSDKGLVAYWVGAEDVTSEHLCAETLRSWLSDVLPDYMVPAAYVQLDRLPLTPNGKLDRKALPAPDGSAYAAHAYEAPQGAIEQAIAAIWSELLGLERIGRHDNFFALGGHSLLAVRVASRLRQELGAEIGVAELFAHATPQRLAACVASSSAAVLPPILPLAPDAPRVLSFAQQRLWFLSQFEGVSQAYHISGGLRLRGALETQALQSALDRIVARHASLRTTFGLVDGQALQQIAAEDSGFQLIAHDLRDMPEREAKLEQLLAEEAQAPFALERGPLIRGVLVQLAHDEYVFFVTMHHIVSDGWSMGILINELSVLYRAFARGEADPLPPLLIQYADYASWQRQWLAGEVLQQQAAYWREALSGAPVLLELPTDRPRPARQEHVGAMLEVVVEPQQAQALKELSQRHGLTLYMTLLASWALLLSRLSGQDDVVIGSPVANRGRSETEGLIGFFVNTLALRVEVSGSPTLAQLLASVKERALQAQAHQDIPFEQVVELVQPPRSLAHAPLFQVMFAWQNTPQGELDLGELEASGLGTTQTSALFDLSLSLEENTDGIVGSLTYATALFEHATLERWMGHWRHLLAAMVAEGTEDMAVDRLSLLGEAERYQVLMEWNAKAADYQRDACVHELFEAQVIRDPSAIAVVQGKVSMTYAELNARANQLAHYLRELGVGLDDRVAILLERGIAAIAAMLGALKAGAAYVPLDSTSPVKRLHELLDDCRASIVIVDQMLPAALRDELTLPTITVADSALSQQSAENPEIAWLGPQHPAYVMYTSGSTGQPKGVIVSQAAVLNLVLQDGPARLRTNDRVAFASNPAFDSTTLEVWGSLLNGATIVIVPSSTMRDPQALGALLVRERLSVLILVAGVLRVYAPLIAPQLGALRLLLTGGDVADPHALAQVFTADGQVTVLQTYGPTESTQFVTALVLEHAPDPCRRVPIGRPLTNTRLYVLDSHGQLAPIGVAGELYIAGAQLAQGYLHRPALTAERFIPDPFAERPGARMYKTGDLARYLADGSLDFLGRNDAQVKIRGFRIEPGEIEAALHACDGVCEAVVIARQNSQGDRHLVAYLVGDGGGVELNPEAVRTQLGGRLPDYMLPSVYVYLDCLPLTPNGKLDRKALPAPDGATYGAHTYEAPQGDIEQAIAAIWRDLLGLERIGRHDNFFALGGHSLLAVRVASRLRQELGAEIGVAELFAHATLQRLAACVASSSAAVLPPILPLEPDAPRVLSFAQQRLWFLSQFEGVSQAYHISGGLRLRGALDTQALQRTLDRIVARHASLRTTFALVDGQALQQIAAEDSGFQLIAHDLRDMPEREAKLEQLLAEEAQAPFALERGPLIRGVLVQLAHDEYVFFVTMHHIVSDGWSMGILINELSVLYRAFARGEADPLPPLPIQYADYASWQRQWLAGEVLQQQAAYWREALSGAPVLLELPTDRPRPPRQDHAGATLEMVVEPQQAQALKELSQRHGLTMYMTLLASWALLLSRLSGQDDVVIGSPVANRGRSETEGLIGFFVNTLALRVEVSGSPTLAQLLASVKERALQAQAHQDIPFEQVVELVQPPRSLAHAPLFQVMFSWQNTPQGELDLGELEASGLGTTQTSAKFDLSLSLAESEEGIVGSLTYATTLFEHATLERWMGHWRHLLAAMLAEGAEDMAVDRLPLLGEAERKQVLMEWNATETDYPRDACVHELFEAQVARDPSAIAVVQGEVSLTYGELNARANRLAHYLRELGVRPADRMAICVQRSVEMVVALLAVLKAGGAYVPLDPAYPPERLTYILADCDAIRVLAVKDTILPERLEVLRVNIDDAAVNVAESDNPRLYSHGSTSAYVMYTSGSTGLPKGVEIPHRGINRLVLNNGYLPFHPSDRVAFAANPSFDATTLEVWGALLNGARMIVIEADVLLSQVRLAETIKCEGITILLLAAGLFHQYADSMKEAFGHLRYLLAGGDAIDPSVVAKVLDGDSPQHFLNCYGPTEITTIATTYEVVEIDDGLRSLPIGRPIANTQIYILDGYGTPVPIGVVGELYLGGDGVARGYLNREELTAERFLTDPFSADPTARMYRSGDLGRWCADGTIEFVGRNDHQVKIRGFRIELGEIEARLSAHAQVRECVVVALDADAGNDKRLVAYWVGAEDVTSEHLGAEDLRSLLSDVLPDYMVPAAYVQLDRLPLTPNGKLDRKALPAPDGAAYAARAYEAPQGAIEQAIATIWSDLLGLETIGRHDNFFALGGHSLLAVRVASRLRQELGAEIGVAELFAHATPQRLAACVASSSAAVLPPILPLAPDAPRVLSFAQQRLWFLSQFEGVSQAYHISSGLRLRGALDTQALQRTLDRIVARHASLRTTFALVDGQALQQIAAEDSGFQLIVHDLRDMPEREAALEQLLAEEAQAPFALEHGPLIRGVLVQLSHDEHVLFVTMHHIVSDGWSMGILINELSALYRAFAHGESDPLKPLPIQYADYASWQRQWLAGEVLQQQATYWRETLSGVPVLLELPTDRPRPPRQDHAGATLEVVVEPQQLQALKELSQRHGLTLYMTLLASWALLLSRLSCQDDVVIGSPVANRGRSETEGLIGFFVNTLALRVELSGSPTLAQLLASVKERALQAQAHQDIPFEQVVELVQPPRSLSHAPLFQVMFAWQNTPEGDLDLGELDASGLGVAQTSAQFDLSLSLAESEEGIVGTLIYATALFEHATLERWMGHWRYLLAAMVAEGAEDMAVDRLPLLDEAERHQVLMEWNATSVDYPRDACVHELFEAQVARDPSAIAVVQGEVSLTYGELNTGSNRLAHYLRELGVVPDDRVAICVQRSVEMVVAVLAVLKAGGAYVPLDPAYPPERLAYMHADCGAVAVLTDAASRSLVECSATSALIVDLQADSEHWEHLPDSNPVRHANGLTARHLVYVIYTSGSTGAPKGVMVSHHALTTCLHALIDLYRLGPQDRILQFAALAFDASVEELFGALCSGATLVLRDDTWLDTERFWPQCAHAGISVVDLPTRFWAQLCAQSLEIPACVRQLIIGGEALTPAMRQHWVQGTRMPLLDTYGPTEAVVVATAQAVAIDTPSGIGRPLAATRAYVLDRAGQPLPIGARGELHLAGAAMARGYLGRPDLTAERFVPDPFAAHPGARMYHTGDLGRWRADGTIEFLGRNDHQVKIRGFRIELGEIEARLSTHADVRECVVVTLEEAGSNEKRLVAYWVGAEGVTSEHLGAEDLRSLLSDVLPDYMVPAAYVQLDRLPLTPNGKLDRKALPAPDGAAYAARAYEAPQGAIEQAIAAIWSDLLGLETIGRHDNFFALGGHSLLAVRVASRLRQELGAEIGVAELFAHATPQRLAACVASSSAAVLPPILPLAPDAPRVLSFAQQRLWFLSQFEGVSQAYHISGGLRLRGALDTQALQRTLDRIVARHASLRTTFALVDGQALQQIAAEDSGFQLIVHDLRDMPEREAALEQLLAEEAQAPFALEHGPLIRGVLVQLSHDEHVLFVTMHHIVSDGWSMGILINELSALYRAFAHGESDPLKPLPIQYADYASWQRQWLAGEVLQQQATYWRETLSGVPVLLELPTDRPRPPRQDHAGATLEVVVEPQQLQALKELSQRHGLTLYMTLLASWALLLSRLSGQDDVVIGSPVANRGRSETEGLIGFFVNTLALRVEVSGSPTLAQLLASVKERALQAQAHQDIPFEQVVELVQPPRSLSHAPLFQVMFAWQNTPEGELDLGELEASGLGAARTSAQFDLSLSLAESEEGIVGSLTYATALFEHATLERWMGNWRHLLVAMVAEGAEDMAVDRLPLLDEAERHQVLTEWNATAADYPRDACVHELFEAQVARDPSAIAVVQGEVALTYAELNARSNRLAHYLRGLGVRPDDRVAICVQRSVEMVVALLAVLKAGGAYVPLDAAYPPERLAYMHSDCGAVAVLTDAASRRLVECSATAAVIVDLQADSEHWAHLPDSNPDRHANGLTARHLAYVIYTSGSTGAPKGSMNEHRSVVNLALAQIRAFNVEKNSRVMQFSSLSFDAFASELLVSLFCGASLYIADPGEMLAGENLARILSEYQISHVTLPPSVLHNLPENPELPCLKTLVVAGEALSTTIAKRWCQGRRLINAYGPTETTVCASVHECDASATGTPPIGRPISNVRIYILDTHGVPVPVGVVGELYIGGDGVARGYLNREDLTAERFLTDPFSADRTARIYRSGDLGRWRADGTIEFVGRNDHQVKIRGFRIELGEIEARLSAHADVRECVVVALEDATGSDKRLVAYWVGAEGVTSDSVDADALRSWLSAILPDYMVPAAYVQLDRLPLTPNGKLDRKALPAPDVTAYAARAYEAPQGAIEQTIAAIWRDLLGLETIGRHDNFFALGGHSLMAVQVVSRLKQAGVEISIGDLFSNPVMMSLADYLKNGECRDAYDGLVPFRKEGSGSPLFLLYDGFCNVMYGRKIVEFLRCDIQVYGVEYPEDPAINTIQDMAAQAIEKIRRVQPSGPYHLAGWSFGGLVAYEMASQLIDAGLQVKFLGVFDTFHISTDINFREEIASVSEMKNNDILRYFCGIDGDNFEDETMKFSDLVGYYKKIRLLPEHLEVDELLNYTASFRRNIKASLGYCAPSISIKLHLFEAAEFAKGNPRQSWQNILPKDSIRFIQVPGTHQSMMDSPNVEFLSEALSEALAGC